VIAVEKPAKDSSLAANYRPISLLSVCYKLLERLALQRIFPIVEGLLSPVQSVCYKLLERLALQRIFPIVEGLLSPDQAGFRKDRSTCDQVAAPTIFIEHGFQQNLKTGAFFSGLNSSII